MSAAVWVWLCLLGGAGAVARFLLDGAVMRRSGGAFPSGTLAVNLLGTFALGVVTGVAVGGDARVLVAVGFLGSFTTFSTWMLESHRLGEEWEGRLGLANLGVSVVAGVAALAAGWALGAIL